MDFLVTDKKYTFTLDMTEKNKYCNQVVCLFLLSPLYITNQNIPEYGNSI